MQEAGGYVLLGLILTIVVFGTITLVLKRRQKKESHLFKYKDLSRYISPD